MIMTCLKKWILKGVLKGFDELKPAIAGIIREEQKRSNTLDPEMIAGTIVDHVEGWVFSKLHINKDTAS